tara:strand:+ start:2544 stop:3785 length:1242 start_codon:yes stop_codon:yes gene_type:complete
MPEIALQREQFLRDGYVIVRDVVPADQLVSLCSMVDEIVEREHDLNPEFSASSVPRLDLAARVDADMLDLVRFPLHENTMGLSSRLLDCSPSTIALSALSVLCNPEFDPDTPLGPGQPEGTDPRNWHRDIRPDHDGPLSVLLDDLEANGPAYSQWNIALCDEAILHLIPGSHRRLNSGLEADQLKRHGGAQMPLPGEIAADLKAGDGVVYNSMLLHWANQYTKQKRRTIHLGYRTFGKALPNHNCCGLPERICSFFPDDSPERQALAHGFALYRDESMVIGDVFRALLAGDREKFSAGVTRLHLGGEGRLTCVILLSKVARNLFEFSKSDDGKYVPGDSTVSYNVQLKRQMQRSFDAAEIQQVCERFQPLDRMLRTGVSEYVGGFLGTRTDYVFEQLPAAVTEESVMAAVFPG